MASRNVLQYLHKMNYVQIHPEETILDELIGAVLATLGIYFQLSVGYVLPVPLNILLSPFTAIELILTYLVFS